MNISDKEKIIKAQIRKKIEKLVKIEKELTEKDFSLSKNDFKISRKIYACFDGFIILRTFSKDDYETFQLIISTERIGLFIKNRLPIKSKDGQIFSLYELLKNSIGLELKIGNKIDLGSRGGGLTVSGQIQIDGFQIMIKTYDDLKEISETVDDISFILFSNTEFQKLEIENNEIKLKINELENSKEPIIIAEGKTDWKYFISSLRHFHSRNEFQNINESWFLKFGTGEDVSTNNCGTLFTLANSVPNLNKILDSFIETRKLEIHNSFPIRIGIFDSDDNQAKERTNFDNKVYSFLIEPKDISTELLFSEDEIKQVILGKRLYLGTEFDEKTGQLLADRSIILGNDNNTRNKAGKIKIIDSAVFNSEGTNIALSKEEFAKSVFLNEIEISAESWENFRHIFKKIEKIIRQ